MMANKLAGPFLQNSLHSQKTLFQRRERLRTTLGYALRSLWVCMWLGEGGIGTPTLPSIMKMITYLP
ncbi:hypothetical protein IMCC3135_22420 [Granulosicoccus antarcticus IMCC3135]|uniref:Uncharacterized protein n=1 Tax=Granulosicoccus antarcticus IMCC3135 TaxID=1192854 RepID=A0A2Z2P3Z3_9GAMM|nr:hypothetical protein IMCC3135_22420 [Granulosicoccus antarcticus IMCC3135]